MEEDTTVTVNSVTQAERTSDVLIPTTTEYDISMLAPRTVSSAVDHHHSRLEPSGL